MQIADWWCWSSKDLVDWKLESVVQPNVSLAWSTSGEQHECWATDGAYRNGKYYFYLSGNYCLVCHILYQPTRLGKMIHKKSPGMIVVVGPADIGVVTSDSVTVIQCYFCLIWRPQSYCRIFALFIYKILN